MVNHGSHSDDTQNGKRDSDNVTILSKERWRQDVEFVLKYYVIGKTQLSHEIHKTVCFQIHALQWLKFTSSSA